jgi:hypothetical protein
MTGEPSERLSARVARRLIHGSYESLLTSFYALFKFENSGVLTIENQAPRHENENQIQCALIKLNWYGQLNFESYLLRTT